MDSNGRTDIVGYYNIEIRVEDDTLELWWIQITISKINYQNSYSF